MFIFPYGSPRFFVFRNKNRDKIVTGFRGWRKMVRASEKAAARGIGVRRDWGGWQFFRFFLRNGLEKRRKCGLL